MTRKSARTGRALIGILVTAALLGSVPAVGAQNETGNKIQIKGAPSDATRIESGLDDGRLAPETGEVIVSFKFQVTVPPTSVCPRSMISVEFTPYKTMPWSSEAKVTLAPSVANLYYDQTATGAAADFDVGTKMTVRVTRHAPAFQSGEYGVSAIARPVGNATSGCALVKSDAARSSVLVANDYLPILEYAPVSYVQRSGQNKEVTFYVRITNLGNGQTKVTTDVAPASKNRLDVVAPPSKVTIDSRAEMGASAENQREVAITARTPHSNGYTNSLYAFTASFTATPTQGWGGPADKQSLTLSVQVQGVYVPGFDVASAVGALAVALVGFGLATRRKER